MTPPRRAEFELALPLVAVALVVVLVVPLPTYVLDGLLASSLALGLAIVTAALRAPEGKALTVFPSALLLTTVFRLATDVAAARLILARGDAGEVIRAFGRLVMAGDAVTGAVLFVILTAVQYIVVTRGAERVAEVAARFTLDALPGRQLAIDADLRAGVITRDEARRRRDALDRESQFHGAMDGAARFIRGDALAAIVIVAAELVGGASLGVARRGMGVGDALARYGLLAVGQGLVAQVPALMVAVAAGVLVTRVAGAGERRSLGGDLAAQLFAGPWTLGVAAVALLALALVPGMPAGAFAVVGAALALVAWWRRRRGGGAVEPAAKFVVECDALDARAVSEVRKRVMDDLGVAMPELGAAKGGGRCALVRDGVPWARGEVVDDASARRWLEKALRANAWRFVGVQETRDALDRLAQEAPALVQEAAPAVVSVVALAEVLRGLVREGVSVRNLRDILEAIVRGGDASVALLVERARVALRAEITWRYAPQGALRAWHVAAEIEEAVRDAVARGRGEETMPPDLEADVVTAVRAALGDEREGVILVRPDVRRYVRAMLASELPGVVVLAYTELEPTVEIEWRGWIRP